MYASIEIIWLYEQFDFLSWIINITILKIDLKFHIFLMILKINYNFLSQFDN